MVIHKPLHPGIIVKDALLTDTDLNVSTAAKKLGVDRTTLSRLLNGHLSISPEMSMRLSIFLRTSPELWMNLQRDFDLWQIRKMKFKIQSFKKAA